MHYKNGRKAEIGDKVVGKTASGDPIAGIIVDAYPGTDSCNVQVVPLPTPTYCCTAGEMLHVDDALQLQPSVPGPPREAVKS